MKRKVLNQAKVKMDGFDYDVTQAQTDGVRIEDPGTGKPIIMRSFEYRYPPNGLKPTKEQLLTPAYIQHLENGLWADGLEMILPPKVVFYKKGFRIFATCQEKKGMFIPREVQDQLIPLQTKIQTNG